MMPHEQALMQTKHQFDTITALAQKGSAIQQSLGLLSALGQSVTRNDVMQQTLLLMQAGHMSPKEAAGHLGSVPLGGPAVGEWVAGKHQEIGKQMEQIGQAWEVARQRYTDAALQATIAEAGGSNGRR